MALAFSEDDPDAIETAMISKNIGIEPRDEHGDHDAEGAVKGVTHSYVWCGLIINHHGYFVHVYFSSDSLLPFLLRSCMPRAPVLAKALLCWLHKSHTPPNGMTQLITCLLHRVSSYGGNGNTNATLTAG